VDGTIPSPYSEKRIAAPPAPKSVILGSNDGRVSVSLGSLIADASPDDHQEVLDLDERAILRAAKEIRQRQIGEWRSRQRDREEQARSRLEGEQEWRVTGDQGVVECQLVISDPPYGITSEPWEPADIESFTRDWCGRWSACGADFFAVFWSQVRLFEGKQWFDESLKGYEFQQLLTWHAPNNNAHNSRQRFKETWEPIFLYRRHGSDRMIFKQDKPWGNGLLSHDCHVAPVPEGNYKGVDCKVHPCQKPLSVMRWLVYALTEPGEMVASPFAGVAPCGVAATQLGRKYHGIEIDDEYRRIAEGRIAAYGVDRR
jgi:hypothetical protein